MATYITQEDFQQFQTKITTLFLKLLEADKGFAEQIGEQKKDLNKKIEEIKTNLDEQSNNLSKKIQGIEDNLPSSGKTDFSDMDDLLKNFQKGSNKATTEDTPLAYTASEEVQSLYSPYNIEVA